LEEYYQELEEIALGWLGWSPDQTLYADVNAIIIGYYGRNKMLQVMQGLDPNAPQPSKPNGSVKSLPSSDKLPPLTPEAFDRMFPGKPAKRTRPSKGK
jgi:hypothetical protein